MLVKNIRRLCQEHDISIKKLEETLGIGNGIIARWETSAPSVTRVKAVADYFGVTVDELLTDHDTDEEAAADGTD
jgi:transcriptional regulator with XRE-family HTH domain